MNRLLLSGDPQTLNLTFNDTNISGSGSAEIIVLDIGVDNLDNFLIQNPEDAIYFGYNLSEYQITNSGGNIVRVKDSSSNNVYIAVNSNGIIGFADGQTTLSLDGITPQINGITLTTTPINTSLITLDSVPQSNMEAGTSSTKFTKIIDGGNASSTYL